MNEMLPILPVGPYWYKVRAWDPALTPEAFVERTVMTTARGIVDSGMPILPMLFVMDSPTKGARGLIVVANVKDLRPASIPLEHFLPRSREWCRRYSSGAAAAALVATGNMVERAEDACMGSAPMATPRRQAVLIEAEWGFGPSRGRHVFAIPFERGGPTTIWLRCRHMQPSPATEQAHILGPGLLDVGIIG